MEEKDKIIVKWAQEDVETSKNMLNKFYIYIYTIRNTHAHFVIGLNKNTIVFQ